MSLIWPQIAAQRYANDCNLVLKYVSVSKTYKIAVMMLIWSKNRHF